MFGIYDVLKSLFDETIEGMIIRYSFMFTTVEENT